jgi:uncharacterized protein (TIGR02246 family)
LTTSNHSKNGAKMTAPAAAVLILAAACLAAPTHRDSSARRQVEEAVTRYVTATNEGDSETLTSLYAEDAVLLPPDHEAIQGREAIGAFWSQGTDEGLELRTLRIEVDGNVGYLVGNYHLPATEEEPADSGKYVMCLRRQADGNWKLTADIWNSSSSGDDAEEPRERGPGPLISRAPSPASPRPL